VGARRGGKGPKLEARRAEPGVGFLGRGGKLPSGVRGEARPPRVLVHFWVLRVSSPAVVLLDLRLTNRDLQKFDYQPADKLSKLLRGQKDTLPANVAKTVAGRRVNSNNEHLS